MPPYFAATAWGGGTTSDDGFLQLVWARFFGGDVRQVSFKYRTAKARRKATLRATGRGSKTVERAVRKSASAVGLGRFASNSLKRAHRELGKLVPLKGVCQWKKRSRAIKEETYV